jgi:hypothetical protein
VREKTGKYERIDKVADPLEFQRQAEQQTKLSDVTRR